jgi:hypothetical protein
MAFTYPEQAAAIYLFLSSMAKERQIVTYGETAAAIGRVGKGRLIAPALKILHLWCEANNKPAMTTLVVSQSTQEVGSWLAERIEDLDAERLRVCDHDWSVDPPRLEDIQAIKLTKN